MTKEEAKKYLMNIREAIIALERELCEDISEDGTLTVNVEDGTKVRRVLVCGDNHFGGLYYPEQESCEELDFVQPHKKVSVNLEPCEDCIRREDALMALTGEYTESPIEILSKAIKRINALPLVNSTGKVGHWERVQYDGNPNIGNWHCSECSAVVNYTPTYNWEKKPYHKFCPNCGAKMQEVVK